MSVTSQPEVATAAAPQSNAAPPAVAADRYIHSEIFEKLVSNADDLPGLVAYGLYQQEKRQFIAACKERDKALPSDDKLKDFALGFQGDKIRRLKESADSILFGFASSLIKDRKEQIAKEAYDARTTQELNNLQSSIRKISGYRHHIVGHVLGFIVLVFLTFIFSIAITKEPHLAQLVSWVFSKNDNSSHEASPPPPGSTIPPQVKPLAPNHTP